MYIKVYEPQGGIVPQEGKIYTNIVGLSFDPSTDLAGASLPVNEFEVSVHTEDTVSTGTNVELYDDNDVLWASYWVIYAEHHDMHTLTIRCQSNIAMLECITLPAVYYSAESVSDVLDNTIVWDSGSAGTVVTMAYMLDNSFAGETITGFCPEQTARERLLWVCFTLGAYVKTYFNNQIEILPIDNSETMVPMADTYWKPTITFNDWVTAIKCKAYSFTAGTPQTTDTYVKDANGTYYIVTETELSLANPSVPEGAPENVINIDGVYLVNQSNVSGILTHLSQWYFKRMEVDLDAIDNGAYIPGDKVVCCVDESTVVSGYINSASFTFGLQSKATIHLTAAEDRESGNLTIIYKYETTQLDKRIYLFPVGYAYTITNPYIDLTMNGHRYIFRPLNVSATGTIAAGDNTDTEDCAVALDLDENGVLELISVDNITAGTDAVSIKIA